eukprot:3372337-Alexandrium_andersonii.AAC.1
MVPCPLPAALLVRAHNKQEWGRGVRINLHLLKRYFVDAPSFISSSAAVILRQAAPCVSGHLCNRVSDSF